MPQANDAVRPVPSSLMPNVPLYPVGSELTTEPGCVVASIVGLYGAAPHVTVGSALLVEAAGAPRLMNAGLVPIANAMTGLGSTRQLALASMIAWRSVPVPAPAVGLFPLLSRLLVTVYVTACAAGGTSARAMAAASGRGRKRRLADRPMRAPG